MILTEQPPTQATTSPGVLQDYPLIHEKYFNGQPEDMIVFKNLIHLVPETVSQIGQILDKPQEELSQVLNKLYQIGIMELITICTDVSLEDFNGLKVYAKERLSSSLMAEIETF